MSLEASLQAWMTARAAHWRKLAALTATVRRNRRSTTAQALDAIDVYRNLARDLSLSRRLLPKRAVTRALEEQYGILHGLIYRPPGRWSERLIAVFARQVPALMSDLRTPIQVVVAVFVSSALAGAWLVTSFPELIRLMANEGMISTVESGGLWTDNLFNVAPPALLSIGILSNNIAVSFFAFCSGVLFGLGTFYVISLNGFMLGAIFAFTHQYDLAGRLFRFVIAHGVVELSVICLAGAGGMAIGEALIRPTAASRTESFRNAVAKVSPLLLVCTLLLIGCGFIEGYISPNPAFPLWSRLAVGLGYGALMLAALNGQLYPPSWRKPKLTS